MPNSKSFHVARVCHNRNRRCAFDPRCGRSYGNGSSGATCAPKTILDCLTELEQFSNPPGGTSCANSNASCDCGITVHFHASEKARPRLGAGQIKGIQQYQYGPAPSGNWAGSINAGERNVRS